MPVNAASMQSGEEEPHTIDSRRRVQGSEFSAGDDLILNAGDDLRLTASRLQAGQEATLLAGDDIEFRTAQQLDYSLYKKKSSGGLFGGSRTQRDEVSRTRSIGSEVNTGGDLLIASGLDQTYQAARLESEGDIELRSGGTIRFETASDMHTESHERSKSSFAWQSSSGEGFTRETLRQSELVAQGDLIIQAAEGLQIDVEKIDRRSVTRTIDAMVAANPDLAWLQEMEQRGDVDWRQVKAFHDSWDYEQSGLGAGAALVVAIVAAATGQYYALAALGGASAGAVAIAASAAAGSLAGTGAVSLVNNRGDLGTALGDTFSSDSLRSAATAALTAGATPNGGTGNLNLSFGSGSDILRFAGQRASQAVVDAGIRSAVEGGSYRNHLGDSLENAVHHVASGVLFNAVGDFSHGRFDNGSPEKIALHALTGGLVAEAMGGDFRTGAMAAGANEALVEFLDSKLGSDPQTRTHFLTTASQLVGIVAAELVNGDVYQGAEIAAQATRYNYLRHDQVDAYVDELEGCEARGDCTEIQEKYRALSIAQQDELIALCATDSAACAAEYQHLVDDSALFREALDGFGGSEIPWQIGLDAGPLLGQYMEAESVVSQEGFAQFLQEQHGLDLEQASLISAAAAGAVGGIGGRTRSPGGFSGRYESNPKHDVSRPGVSPQPSNPERALADSVPIGGNSTSRIAYDSSTGEIVMFQNHQGNNYHGYAVTWNDLRQNQKNALINAGLFRPNGKPK
ncbi:DUF637 domain-containing protein [Billgrantia sp. Q4P2]|uniref:DUF637 domain-containing protein n=1 Tax=Billgrantia sp. Q4P2 TaxID=3463857 RepID=UPI00405726BE